MSNKIRTEKIYRIPFLEGEEPEPESDEKILQSLREFDKDGNLLLEISYSTEGGINEKNEFQYDRSGKLAKSLIYGDDDEPLESKVIYRDEKQKILKEEIIYLDGSIDIVEYRYQDESLKEKIQKTDEDEIELREVFDYQGDDLKHYERYDEDGRLVYRLDNTFEENKISQTEIFSTENGESTKQLVYFNDSGRREAELRYNSQGKLVEKNTFEEDEEGRVISMTEENLSGKNTTTMSYNNEGRLVSQEETDVNGQLISHLEREYDAEGRPQNARILYLDRRMGTIIENFLVYEYDFFEE